MRRLGRTCLFLLLGLTGLMGGVAKSLAVDDASVLVEKYEATRKQVVETEAQKRKILGSLYGINQRMKRITSEKDHLTDELFQSQYTVKNLAKVIAALEAQIQSQRQHLRKRLRALYKLSGEGYLAILFSRKTPQELDQTMRFLKIVTDNDYHLIRAYQANVATYKAEKQKLRGQVEKLMAIEKNIKRQENLLLAEHHAKSKIVSTLDREKLSRINRMKSLRDKGEGLNLGDLLQASIFEKKGQLEPPVSATVIQDFGLVTNERYKIRLAHKGWLYESASASAVDVTSIFDGSVIFADVVEGYGQLIVLDHGDHYYSIYAHISRVIVKTGDTIKKGQVLAQTGSIDPFAGDGQTGRANARGEKRGGLYFEIRHFSEPENPAGWIRHGNDSSSIAKGDS